MDVNFLQVAFKYETFLALLLRSFGDREGTIQFCQTLSSWIIKPQLVKSIAYRGIILSDSLENEGWIAWKRAQLDYPRIKEPFSSWSKTYLGAQFYVNKHGSDSYLIFIEGEVLGFELISFTKQVVESLNVFLKDNGKNLKDYSDKIDNPKIYYSLTSFVTILNQNIVNYGREEEIIAVEVINYSILDAYRRDSLGNKNQ